MTRPPHNAGRQLLLQTWQRVGIPLAQSGQCTTNEKTRRSAWYLDQDFRSRRFRKEGCGHKKVSQAIYALGVLEVCCLNQPSSDWAAGVGGWGAAQLGLIS